MVNASDVRLIDLDASARIDKGYSGAKFSSAYAPPELIHKISETEAQVKTYSIDTHGKPEISGLQYEPIIAHPAHDVWAFGIVLYYMCTGMSLFQEDFYSNVKDETLVKIHEFSDEFREHSLGSIINLKARNLASLLLQKDPL